MAGFSAQKQYIATNDDIDTTEKDGHKEQEDREAADFISLFRTFFSF